MTRADPILIVKVSGPVLYGFFGFSTFIFGRKFLKWDSRRSLLLVLVLSADFVSLRLSWDLFRNTLGISFLLAALSVGTSLSRQRTLGLASLLVLTSLAHLLAGTLAVSISLFKALVSEKGNLSRALATLPAAGIVLGSLVERSSFVATTDIASSSTVSNYIFLGYVFSPLIPLALLGLRSLQVDLLKSWLVVCFIGVVVGTQPLAFFDEIVVPYRWAILMTLPLSAYAVEGLHNLRSLRLSSYRVKMLTRAWMLLLLFLAGTYVALPANEAFPFYQFFTPTSMLQSTVPMEDSPNVIASFQWLSDNIRPETGLMTTDAMYGWAREYFVGNETTLWYHPGMTLQESMQAMLNNGYSCIYTVWWSNGQGWYDQPSPPSEFALVHQSGSFGVFLYCK